VLALLLASFAQSTDNIKQDQPQQQDQMKHDDMSQDQSKKDAIAKEARKTRRGEKDGRNENDSTKKTAIKHDDNMKQLVACCSRVSDSSG